MMAILKVESKCYKLVQVILSLHITVTFIRAVENVRLAKNENFQTHIFNGSNKCNGYIQRQQNLHVRVALALYFQNHHHLCL